MNKAAGEEGGAQAGVQGARPPGGVQGRRPWSQPQLRNSPRLPLSEAYGAPGLRANPAKPDSVLNRKKMCQGSLPGRQQRRQSGPPAMGGPLLWAFREGVFFCFGRCLPSAKALSAAAASQGRTLCARFAWGYDMRRLWDAGSFAACELRPGAPPLDPARG